MKKSLDGVFEGKEKLENKVHNEVPFPLKGPHETNEEYTARFKEYEETIKYN